MLIGFLGVGWLLRAQERSIRTAQPFLLQPQDARSLGMGFTRYASSSFASVMSNPSALLFLKNTPYAVAANYMPSLFSNQVKDIYHLNLSGFYKLNYNDALGASLRLYTFGKVDLVNDNFDAFGQVRPFSWAADMSYMRRLSEEVGLSVSGRYIGGHILSQAQEIYSGYVGVISAQALALDMAVTFHKAFKDKRASVVQIGTALTNMGFFMGNRNNYSLQSYLPANMALGFTYAFDWQPYHRLSLSLELNKLLVPVAKAQTPHNPVAQKPSVFSGWWRSFYDGANAWEELSKIYYAFGVENWSYERVALRLGYYQQNQIMGLRKVVTFGLGFRFLEVFQLDLAYAYNIAVYRFSNPLPHLFSLSFIYSFFKEGYNDRFMNQRKRRSVPNYY